VICLLLDQGMTAAPFPAFRIEASPHERRRHRLERRIGSGHTCRPPRVKESASVALDADFHSRLPVVSTSRGRPRCTTASGLPGSGVEAWRRLTGRIRRRQAQVTSGRRARRRTCVYAEREYTGQMPARPVTTQDHAQPPDGCCRRRTHCR